MVCETHGAFVPAPYGSSRLAGARRRRAAERIAYAEAAGPLERLAGIGFCYDREDTGSNDMIPAPAGECQSRPWLGARAALAPVGTAGSLVGSVSGPRGWLTPVRLLVRDARGAVVRECSLGHRGGPAGGRFELRALPAGTYLLEVQAPGFYRELRPDVWVEPACVTDVGTVRLTRLVKRHRRRAEGLAHPSSLSPRGARVWGVA